uniref:Sec-independent protein secretion pathway component n=1 Tax=Monodopsis sp. MarTras21 TaxID=1745953 RepID=A0A140F2Z5_9STRA|nr:sec-independent protein secretion pathway component [Monodopsis sp. MarTras21]
MISFGQFLILFVIFFLLFGDVRNIFNKLILLFVNFRSFFKKSSSDEDSQKKS